MRILITGSNGLLGQKLVRQCLKRKINFLASSKGGNRNIDCPEGNYSSLDICDVNNIHEVFDSYKPTHVIHTAAITNVDYCEENLEECEQVNVIATQLLFEAALKCKAHFQLLSTDFVFDGEKGNYEETDDPAPLSVYAKSKVDGENLLLKSPSDDWSIVRTIIVYGIGNNLSRSNIICWAKDVLTKGQEITIVDDQFRAPTWADDLAWACIRICELNEKGIFHISGPETMSIFELVNRVANHFNLPTDKVKSISSTQLNQAAKRPPKTGFNLMKSHQKLGYSPKTLEETLDLI
jgi:dTDP-4-dehydrorhamnose reductase